MLIFHSGIIAEKPSESLFTLDITGSEAIQDLYDKAHKPLKADQILAQRSTVPAIDSRKRPGYVTDGVIELGSKRRKSNGVSPREYERLREVAYGAQSIKDIIKTDGAPDYDPWAFKEEKADPRFSYLEKQKPIRAPSTLKEAPISLVASAREVPAVSTPKAATSYNPEGQDYDALLTSEGQKEVEAERKRLHQAKLDQELLNRIAAAENEREIDVQTEDESAWEGFESDFEGAQWVNKKRPERKTPAERNKIKRRREAERTKMWEKKMKEREKQQMQIGKIARQMKKEAKARAVVKAEPEEQGEVDERVLRRRRLGKDL